MKKERITKLILIITFIKQENIPREGFFLLIFSYEGRKTGELRGVATEISTCWN